MRPSMSALTEHEIFDRLRTDLRGAVQGCKDLAFFPALGETYLNLIHQLDRIEGACRQVGAFRFDMRWNRMGFEISRFRVRIGDALRSNMSRVIFLHMATMMEGALYEIDKLKDAKVLRRGPILPKAKPEPHRQNRPVGYTARPSGLLLPA
jgi:hypothetical protein